MDKLALIHNLSSDNVMHLLINGVGSRSLREIAASLIVDPTLKDFLENASDNGSIS
jgi:hypothetical protein